MPLECLIGPGITAEELNDDCLGRALEWLTAYDLTALFAGLAEHCIRQRLAQTGVTVLGQLKKPTLRPTPRWLFQCFEGISLVLMELEERMEAVQVTGLTNLHLLILGLLGPPYKQYGVSSKHLSGKWDRPVGRDEPAGRLIQGRCGNPLAGDRQIASLVAHQTPPTSAARIGTGVGKTRHILVYAVDEEMQRRGQVGMNKGERVNGLARVTFFGQQGRFQQREYEAQLNRTTALSLLINAINVRNTRAYQAIDDHVEGLADEI
jgi:hypothetical protein